MNSLSNIAGAVVYTTIILGSLLGIYSISCSLVILSSQLVYRDKRSDWLDWLVGGLGFVLLLVSWLFWWWLAGRGVYGWLNMMHESFCAGFVGGLFAFLRVWFSGRVFFPKSVSFILITVTIFTLSFFLWHIFDL